MTGGVLVRVGPHPSPATPPASGSLLLPAGQGVPGALTPEVPPASMLTIFTYLRMMSGMTAADPTLTAEVHALINTTPEEAATFPRPLRMAHAYAQGASLRQIGGEYSMSHERVRQIIERQTPFSTRLLRDTKQAIEDQKRVDLAQRVSAWSAKNPAAPISDLLAEFNIDRKTAKNILRRRYYLHAPNERATGRTRVPNEVLVKAVADFHRETGKATRPAYTAWAKEHGIPDAQTVVKRLGSWNDALLAAGVTPVYPKIERERRHSLADLWAALVEAFSVEGGPSLVPEVRQWLRDRPGAPSLELILARTNMTFVEARAESLRLVHEGKGSQDPWVQEVLRPRDWSEFVAPGVPKGQ